MDYDLYSGRSNSSIDSDDLYTLVDPVISRRPRGNQDQEGSNNSAPAADQPITLSDSLQPSEHQPSSSDHADSPSARPLLNHILT